MIAQAASDNHLQLAQTLPEPQLKLHFEVEDTGTGISLDEQQHLFKPFEQTKSSLAASEGTGLGLAISQKFVQLMGGKITIVSEHNQGSLFSFSIPVESVGTIVPPTLRPITQTVVGLAPGQPTYRILIAEDNVTNRYLLVQMLHLPGFALKEVDNGLEAIAVCKQWHPDLILMDMRMPVMNGVEATRQIKVNAETQQTIVIALTASAFEEQRQAFLAVGCDDFLSKPFQRLTLFTKISQHLGVEYLYETKNLAQASQPDQHNQQTSPPSDRDLKDELAKLPEAWRTQLYRAALEGSDRRVFELLQQIPSEQLSLRETITTLVEGFQFDQILTMLSSPQDSAS
jgi:CheY-like chemotaxis protein